MAKDKNESILNFFMSFGIMAVKHGEETTQMQNKLDAFFSQNPHFRIICSPCVSTRSFTKKDSLSQERNRRQTEIEELKAEILNLKSQLTNKIQSTQGPPQATDVAQSALKNNFSTQGAPKPTQGPSQTTDVEQSASKNNFSTLGAPKSNQTNVNISRPKNFMQAKRIPSYHSLDPTESDDTSLSNSIIDRLERIVSKQTNIPSPVNGVYVLHASKFERKAKPSDIIKLIVDETGLQPETFSVEAMSRRPPKWKKFSAFRINTVSVDVCENILKANCLEPYNIKPFENKSMLSTTHIMKHQYLNENGPKQKRTTQKNNNKKQNDTHQRQQQGQHKRKINENHGNRLSGPQRNNRKEFRGGNQKHDLNRLSFSRRNYQQAQPYKYRRTVNDQGLNRHRIDCSCFQCWKSWQSWVLEADQSHFWSIQRNRQPPRYHNNYTERYL